MSQARRTKTSEESAGGWENFAHAVRPPPQQDSIFNTYHRPITGRGANNSALSGVQGPQFEPPIVLVRNSRLTAEMSSKIAKRISPKEYQATPLCNGVSLCAGEERKGRCLGLGFGLGELGVADGARMG